MMGEPYPGLWKFDRHPWAREIHDCKAPMIIGQKAAQMAFTETAMNKAFYAIDMLGDSVLYVLPSKTPGASDFSKSRFDPALEASPHLKQLFTDVQNVGHKRAGLANLFVRGSRSRSQLKSDPAAVMIFDEVEEMVYKNIELALERMSGHDITQAFLLSTPSIDGIGINFYFKMSTQRHFFFVCPHCGKYIELTHDDLVITADKADDPKIKDSHLLCPRPSCKGVLKHEEKVEYYKKNEWVPSQVSINEGYTINQLYSVPTEPWKIAVAYLKSQTDEELEQEYWCSKMGMTHELKGARVTDEDITACTKDYTKWLAGKTGQLVTLGVDVGNKLNVEVNLWHPTGSKDSMDLSNLFKPQVIWEGTVDHFEEVDDIFLKYLATFLVVDGIPEKRKSFELCCRLKGCSRMCFYVDSSRGYGKEIKTTDNTSNMGITVDRTQWLDLALGRIRKHQMILPKDLSMDYGNHVKALVKRYRRDAQTGQVVAEYVHGQHNPDHHGHTRVYNELALVHALQRVGHQNFRFQNG